MVLLGPWCTVVTSGTEPIAPEYDVDAAFILLEWRRD